MTADLLATLSQQLLGTAPLTGARVEVCTFLLPNNHVHLRWYPGDAVPEPPPQLVLTDKDVRYIMHNPFRFYPVRGVESTNTWHPIYDHVPAVTWFKDPQLVPVRLPDWVTPTFSPPKT